MKKTNKINKVVNSIENYWKNYPEFKDPNLLHFLETELKWLERKLCPGNGNDKIYTPQPLADAIVKHFKPTGRFLEPCYGDGAFVEAVLDHGSCHTTDYCEIDLGRDFLKEEFKTKFDWSISNWPFSIYRKFLNKTMEVADNIVTLCPLNHIQGSEARLNDIERAGFYVREIARIKRPAVFPSSGFSWGAILLNKEPGECKQSRIIY